MAVRSGVQFISTLYRKLPAIAGNVAYNDAFRQLLHEPRWYSASQLTN